MIDVHVHVGQFKDGLYFSPEEVDQDMKTLNLERYYFSSTSTGSTPFRYVRRQLEELIALSDGRAIPLLWVSPGMLQHSRNLGCYFFREFAGIKIHGLQGWKPYGTEIRRILSIAREKNLPVMLHTGGLYECDAGAYMNLCLEFHDVRIILAHGRPVDQTIEVMNECPNVWADTAFMPIPDILELKKSGLVSHVLWGTDFPVMRYFYKTPVRKYYEKRIKAVLKILGYEDFEKITRKNFNLFGFYS